MGANRNADPAARLKRLTKLPLGDRFFIPDAIFGVDAPNGARFLYVLEVHNGSDTKRACGQLEKHRIALREGCFSDLYHYPKAHRVLCVFEQDNALQAVTQRLRADAAFMEQQMQSQFAFSTLPALRQDFVGGWQFLEPGRACIFDAQP